MTTAAPRPAFGNGPLARVVVAFLLGAFIVVAWVAYSERQKVIDAAAPSVKRSCAGRLVGDYQTCVVREDAARRAAERQP